MLQLKTLSQCEKCFLDEDIKNKKEYKKGSMLMGESFSFQIAYTDCDLPAGLVKRQTRLTIDSPLKKYITVRYVEHVPVRVPYNPGSEDPDFVRKTPGLYPDLLTPIDENTIITPSRDLQSIWIDIDTPVDLVYGEYTINFVFSDYWNGEVFGKTEFCVDIIPAALPKQEIAVTQWFHADCLATYYNVDIFSEKHWEIMNKFIACAAKNGINMILTPIFTPALDTIPNTERPTVQLIDVTKIKDEWRFSFQKLERWVKMCLQCGIEYFEMSHLFTQWGAKHAPKVMALTEEGYIRVFGWDTDVADGEYKEFLSALLPKLIDKLTELGVADKCVFHISDEPGKDHLQSYLEAKNLVKENLKGQVIMDALSDFEFWKKGVVDRPVVSIDHMEPYIEAGVEGLWTYYCCCQCDKVSNRFVAMPTWRNRVIGQQFYKYNIEGFLQWGFNFYFYEGSTGPLDPYLITDGGFWVPAGDAFSVYPGRNGEPLETIHLLGFTAALYDLRAFKLAEELTSRETVMAILEEAGEIGFKEYPRGDVQVLEVREKINNLIKKALSNQ